MTEGSGQYGTMKKNKTASMNCLTGGMTGQGENPVYYA